MMPDTKARRTYHHTFGDVAQPKTGVFSPNAQAPMARKTAARKVTGKAYTLVGIQYLNDRPHSM
jgi:hypothetical protein